MFNCPSPKTHVELIPLGEQFLQRPFIIYSRKAIRERELIPKEHSLKIWRLRSDNLSQLQNDTIDVVGSRLGKQWNSSVVCFWTARQIEFKIYTRHSLIYSKSFVQVGDGLELDFCLDGGMIAFVNILFRGLKWDTSEARPLVPESIKSYRDQIGSFSFQSPLHGFYQSFFVLLLV